MCNVMFAILKFRRNRRQGKWIFRICMSLFPVQLMRENVSGQMAVCYTLGEMFPPCTLYTHTHTSGRWGETVDCLTVYGVVSIVFPFRPPR